MKNSHLKPLNDLDSGNRRDIATNSTSREPAPAPVSAKARWAGYVFSILPSLLFFYSCIGVKFFQPPGIHEHFAALGWSMDRMVVLGVVELACTVIYLIPRTAILGAILLTGYLGGAIATHMRVGENAVLQIALGVFVWLGLYLRNPPLRALLPFQQPAVRLAFVPLAGD